MIVYGGHDLLLAGLVNRHLGLVQFKLDVVYLHEAQVNGEAPHG